MKIKQPQPFTFEGGRRAVLLLHGFTGHSADVRMLGRFLENNGYTVHAPIYRGHGGTPEDIITATPDLWWEDVLQAYEHLHHLGYKEIAVAGLSMGGALGLKLAVHKKIKAVIPMCTPMFFDNQSQLKKGFIAFAKQYKQLEKKNTAMIEREINELLDQSTNMFTKIGQFIHDVNKQVDLIYTPTFVIQASKDQMINPQSASFIYEHVETEKKHIKWYEESGHAITLDKEKDQLHEDILQFLESLEWVE